MIDMPIISDIVTQDFDGRAVGIPSRNVLFERVEVRNGHGLTLGSEASGGMVNITYRDIFINAMGGPQAPGRRKRPGAVGSIHFKSGRGRGGHWENITWENIYGNGATALFGFSEFHGTSLGPEPATGPTNASGTPTIKNLLIKDVVLTECAGPSVIQTLAEAPIENLSIHNVTWSTRRGAKGGYECTGYNGTRLVNGLFASGSAVNLVPPLPRGCQLLPDSVGAADPRTQ
jgi:polygalacturonase